MYNEQEKEQGLMEWANAFKAKDWETFSAIENGGVKEAGKTMEMIFSTPSERQLLLDRRKAEIDRRSIISNIRAEGRAEGQILQAVKMYRLLVHYSDEQILNAIMKEFSLSKEEAEKYISE